MKLIKQNDALQAHPEYLNEQIDDHDKAVYAKGWNACNSAYYGSIKELPFISTADVRGVGEWIDCPSTHIQDGAKYRMCSVCNEHIAVLGHDLIYCPNCGARMKGAEDGTTDNS